MNIGVDATCWWNMRGFGRFTRELLTAIFKLDLEHRFYLFVDQDPGSAMSTANVEVVQVFPSRPVTDAAIANDRRSVADMVQLYSAVANQPLDLMFFPAVYSWFPVPLGLSTVVTLHDAIAEHFPELVFPNWKSRFFWSLKMKLALWQSHRVLTVSQAAKAEIEQYLGVNPALIDVISEAPDPKFRKFVDDDLCKTVRRRANLPLDKRLIVYVGGLAPHKNLRGFLEGFALAKASEAMADVHVALVGDFEGAGFHSNGAFLAQWVAGNSWLKDSVHFTGFVTDDDLIALYNDALAVAMPSFSEGFGLPAVEAMACGTPVLSSNLGALPEVVGDGGIYFDPYVPREIADAIRSMATEPGVRDRLAAIAKNRATHFTWERAAKLTIKRLEAMST